MASARLMVSLYVLTPVSSTVRLYQTNQTQWTRPCKLTAHVVSCSRLPADSGGASCSRAPAQLPLSRARACESGMSSERTYKSVWCMLAVEAVASACLVTCRCMSSNAGLVHTYYEVTAQQFCRTKEKAG